MPEGTLRVIESEQQPCVYPADIQPLMQTLLATLADIDFGHECELEKVKNSAADTSLKAKMITRLEQRHRERRQPYVEELLALKARMRSVLDGTAQRTRSTTTSPTGRES